MSVDLGLPVPGASMPGDNLWQALGERYELDVMTLGLACCAVESVAAALRADGDPDAGPPRAHVLVVSGTVTTKLAEVVRRAYDRARPSYVLSFGSCANTGGPYWDSYSVTCGVDRIVPVDLYVPGCPPRPEALLDGLAELDRRARGVA